jgi:streptogramin lyase
MVLGIAGMLQLPNKAAAAMTQIELVNPGFESSTGAPYPGWTQTIGTGKFAVTDEQSNTGTYSLVIHDNDSRNYGMQSVFLPAEPNLMYEASVFTYVLKGSSSIYLQFHDENKVRIGYKSVSESGLNNWKPLTASLKAPSGTKYVTVLLYSGTTTITDAYFDDVQLKVETNNEPEPADQHVVRIGTAINSITIPHAGYGLGPNGEPYIYTTANGAPAVFSVVRADTGERVASFPLDQAGYSWGTIVAPNGDVYIATQRNGYLYRYRPSTNRLENVGKPIPTETHLYRVTADEQGNIYGGTYPNGKVFKYNPATGTYTDYGQLAPEEKYVRSIAYGNGKVYAGTGVVKAQLFEINAVSGEKKPIPLPETYSSSKEVYDLTFTSGLLFARMTAADPTSEQNNVTLIYDTGSGTWIGELPKTPGLDVSPIGPDGNVYFVQNSILVAYNVANRTITPTSFAIGNSASRGFGWFHLNQPDMPGATLITITSRGVILAYNPATGKGKVYDGDPLGSANTLRSVATGPDGNIYVGGYLSPSSMTRFNLDTFKMESLTGMSQVEGMGIYNNKLYMGVYPGAAVFEYDPALPWTGSQGTNPARLNLNLETYLQDRPFAFADAGDKLAIGTVPIAGKLGGSLVLYDTLSKASEVFYPIVENESPMALAYKDGLIYGGTTVWGGIAADPVEQDGTLFIFDPKTKQKVFEVNPVPGERAITALTFDNSGMLWGLTNGTLFQFDPAKRQVVRTKVLYPYVWKDIVLAGGYLNFHDGMLYGEAATRIFRFDPQTWEYTTLTNGNYFAQDAFGRIYTTKNSTDLYMYDNIAPSFGQDAVLSSIWTENGSLQLEWPVNADMKSFQIYRDGTAVTAIGTVSRSAANGKASLLLPAEASAPGTYSVIAVDYAGNQSTQPLSAVVHPMLYWAASPALTPALGGEPYSVSMAVYGGQAPYTFTLTDGGLPKGLTLDPVTGTLSGLPTLPGSYSFGITVMSQDGQQALQVFTLNVENPGKSTLASLSSDTGVWDPAFQPSVHDYRVNVWPSVKEIQIFAVSKDAGATIIVNGKALGAGQPVILNVKKGQTYVSLEVRAPRGTGKTVYTVTINACEGPKDGCGEPPKEPENHNQNHEMNEAGEISRGKLD